MITLQKQHFHLVQIDSKSDEEITTTSENKNTTLFDSIHTIFQFLMDPRLEFRGNSRASYAEEITERTLREIKMTSNGVENFKDVKVDFINSIYQFLRL